MRMRFSGLNQFLGIFLLLSLAQTCFSQVITPTLTLGLTPNPTLSVLPTNTPIPTSTSVVTPIPTIQPITTPLPAQTPGNFPLPLILDTNFFNPTQVDLGIHFQMERDGQARISIYNMAGELVRSLVNEYRNKGKHVLYWEGRNNNGQVVGNALYYIIFQYPGGQTIQKVILLK